MARRLHSIQNQKIRTNRIDSGLVLLGIPGIKQIESLDSAESVLEFHDCERLVLQIDSITNNWSLFH